ncbi:alpha-ketoglutarate-dependent dioxygenase AlkB [Ascidiimonas aurantiaca]|uniref:alpha-ketoglutarate-dependent dioxygenase AlkB family protein n=1 Tax=Ascidiimonas aurantiaca TaxID=1685432 RepID=UPI0030EB7EF1
MKPIAPVLPDAHIIYYPSFFTDQEAEGFYERLLKNTPWQQDTITLFGKTHLQPRLTALYASNNNTYSYSGITMYPLPFTADLQKIKKRVEVITEKEVFTTCLLNLYRDGKDSNGWHSDNEKELGKNPVIASVSFGASRWFHLKHRKRKELKHKIYLEHGSVLIMKGSTQDYWLHQVPKTQKTVTPRINLTFRIIK